MPSLARFVVVAALAALVACADTPTAPQPRGDNVILITLDGARIEEMFGGLDVDVLRSTLSPDAVIEKHPLYLRFGAATPEERRRRLMPFFWDVLMARYGSIAGNQRLGSTVQLSNTHRFSYPGYSEMLVGEADDDRIRSNDRIHNPNTTVLEGLKARLSLSANDVAVFGSWDVLNEVVERTPGTLTVNAGYERFELPWAGVEPLNHLQFDTPTPWNSVRHDAYTFGLALAHLEAVQPRVLYLGLGETDDWAHDGRYDRTLESYARADEHLRGRGL